MAKEQDFGHLLPKGTYKVDVGENGKYLQNGGRAEKQRTDRRHRIAADGRNALAGVKLGQRGQF